MSIVQSTTKKVWIFQASPEGFDIIPNVRNNGALADSEYTWDNWKVKQYKNEIKKGDLAVIWVSGKKAGIYAIGEIMTDTFSTDKYNPVCDNYEIDNEAGRKLMAESLDRSILKVTIKHTVRFPNKPLSKDECKMIPELQNVSVIKQPWAGTNFKLTADEWRVIYSFILRGLGLMMGIVVGNFVEARRILQLADEIMHSETWHDELDSLFTLSTVKFPSAKEQHDAWCEMAEKGEELNRAINSVVTPEFMNERILDELVRIHTEERILSWWEGEHPFQIIVETIATQQCKLIDGSMWTYILKLLVDQSIGGNMLVEVTEELEEWLIKNNTTWEIEAEISRKTKDWNRTQKFIENNSNKITSIAARSLWAWYGRNFSSRRTKPEFITIKPWITEHKNWLVSTDTDEILKNMTFNIIGSKRKLDGIKEFIVKENNGQFDNLTLENALKKISGKSVGDETARKIALFYFNLPFPIFDEYLLRIWKRHKWLPEIEKWDRNSKKKIEEIIYKWLRQDDIKTQSERLKRIHAIIDDCGNLYCNRLLVADDQENLIYQCSRCPLYVLKNEN